MLGMLILMGLVAQGLTLIGMLVSLGFGAGMLMIGWLWQPILRERETGVPQPRKERIRQAIVVVVWLAVMAALLTWFFVDRAARRRQLIPLEVQPEGEVQAKLQ
jgi:uncharacterized membrane protein